MPSVQIVTCPDTNDGSAGTVASSTGATLTAGNFVACWVMWADSGSVTVSGVTDGTNALAAITTKTGPDANGQSVQLWGKQNVTAVASPVFTATFSVASTFRRIIWNERSSIAASSAVNDSKQNTSSTFGTGTNAVTSTNGAGTSVANCEIVALGYDSTSATSMTAGTAPNTYTKRNTTTRSAGDSYDLEDGVQAAAGANDAGTFTTTAGTDAIHVHMVALAPLIAAGGVSKLTLLGVT